MYFASGRKALKPMVAKVREIRQNTPTGASDITIMVISIITSLNWLKKLPTVSARSPSFARITPTIRANRMICSISPLASAPMGLSGMMLSSVSVSDVACMLSTWVLVLCSTLRSSPTPGFSRLPTNRATVTAQAVVHR